MLGVHDKSISVADLATADKLDGIEGATITLSWAEEKPISFEAVNV